MKDNKIFAILKKTSLMKLKNSKVNLAAIDDLDVAIDKAEIYSRVILINEAISDSDQLLDIYEELQVLAEVYYSKYEDINNWYSQLKTERNNLEEKMNTYETLTDEVGIDPNTSESYRYGDELILDMDDEFLTYDQNYDRFLKAEQVVIDMGSL
tara:strand:- start:1498 stop:1959 length:462 start_codon:yes stop_codon:yes gene_type:complete